jgi:hypothetical protein
MKRLLLLLALLLPGCSGGTFDPALDQCVQSSACDDVFCGDPELKIDAGERDSAPFEDDTIPITFGDANTSGCGYHFMLAFETENLCPILFVRYQLDLLGIDGARLDSAERLVQFVRTSEDSTVQRFWNERSRVPREFFPDDPEHADVCPEDSGSSAYCNEFELLISVEVEDQDGRIATDQRVLDPVCCL